jgi:hypothetical protein
MPHLVRWFMMCIYRELLGGSGFATLVDGIEGYTPNLGPLQVR